MIGSFQHLGARAIHPFTRNLPGYGENKSDTNSASHGNIYWKHAQKPTNFWKFKPQLSILLGGLMASCIRTNALFAGVSLTFYLESGDQEAGVSNWRQDCLTIRPGALFLKTEAAELTKPLCGFMKRKVGPLQSMEPIHKEWIPPIYQWKSFLMPIMVIDKTSGVSQR